MSEEEDELEQWYISTDELPMLFGAPTVKARSAARAAERFIEMNYHDHFADCSPIHVWVWDTSQYPKPMWIRFRVDVRTQTEYYFSAWKHMPPPKGDYQAARGVLPYDGTPAEVLIRQLRDGDDE